MPSPAPASARSPSEGPHGPKPASASPRAASEIADPRGDRFWRRLRAAAAEPYRAAGPAALWHARGKLTFDPMFRALLADGLLSGTGARLLDLGCGRALLAPLLDAAARAATGGAWPDRWAAAPAALRYTGIERDAADLRVARAATAALDHRPTLIGADLRDAALPASDVVLLLDVLHYLAPAEQAALLQRVHAALPDGGRLLLRIGQADGGPRQAWGEWVDRVVAGWRGRTTRVALSTRPLGDWLALLCRIGFDGRPLPMSTGAPFANVLIDARRRSAPA